MLEKGQKVVVRFQSTGVTVHGTITRKLSNGVYLCRISKNAQENPGQVFRIIEKNLNEMVVLEE